MSNLMYEIIRDLFPNHRSITGDGLSATIDYLKKLIPDLRRHSEPSGKKVFDWEIPLEWNIKDAYVETEKGDRIIDFKTNNLHLVSYSAPVRETIGLNELQCHLHSLPSKPESIPYVTSYYNKEWGFCISHNDRENLNDCKYNVVINSTLKKGFLHYAEAYYKSSENTKNEILISTYICHPSMANNELSGPAVATALARWIAKKKYRKYNYRFVFVPETIGSLTFIQNNLQYLRRNVVAGFNITCVGDERCYSYLPSRKGNTLSDKAALYCLDNYVDKFKSYSWLDRGSDERQYCAPGIDLPIASVMRSKYGTYPEYHTSDDVLDTVVTSKGLEGSYKLYKRILRCLENNLTPKVNVLGEPFLSQYGIYPTISDHQTGEKVKQIVDFISYCDGMNDLIDISKIAKIDFFKSVRLWRLLEKLDILSMNG